MNALRSIGGCAGGWSVYLATKAAARLRNLGRPERGIPSEMIEWLAPLFPELDLARVELVPGASLPPNWFSPGPGFAAMTFGYRVYFRGRIERGSVDFWALLLHELVHVDQVRRRGDSERRFACDYGRGLLAGGSYAGNPLEEEAFSFVDSREVQMALRTLPGVQ